MVEGYKFTKCLFLTSKIKPFKRPLVNLAIICTALPPDISVFSSMFPHTHLDPSLRWMTKDLPLILNGPETGKKLSGPEARIVSCKWVVFDYMIYCEIIIHVFRGGSNFVDFIGNRITRISNNIEIHNLYNSSMLRNHIHESTSQRNSKISTIQDNWPLRISMNLKYGD